MTLDEVKAAKPTSDYDPVYRATYGSRPGRVRRSRLQSLAAKKEAPNEPPLLGSPISPLAGRQRLSSQ